jgi:phenylpropionate dioxygenase-like ring-hydroxylating dioxygenase large terminal subunit
VVEGLGDGGPRRGRRRSGDHLTFDDLGVPVLLVRGSDGVLRAFYNSCQHRGAPVVREARGSARTLRCQYHSWTYDITSGSLVQVPDERDFVGLCKEERGLVPLSCEVWQGWVFVNQDPHAASLADTFGPALEQLEELHGSASGRSASAASPSRATGR